MDPVISATPIPNSGSKSSIPDPTSKAKSKQAGVALPYLSSAGTIKTAFDRIRQAATPDRVTADFVGTKLQMKGGTGASVVPFLKKIGMVASDGSPTTLYKGFRNQTTGGASIALAIKHGYRALLDVNEYFYELNDKELQALIVQVTGFEPASSSTKQIFYTLKALKEYADFNAAPQEAPENSVESGITAQKVKEPTYDNNIHGQNSIGLNLAYTINLNLPASSDQEVFNAIFKSLKEHLLSNG